MHYKSVAWLPILHWKGNILPDSYKNLRATSPEMIVRVLEAIFLAAMNDLERVPLGFEIFCCESRRALGIVGGAAEHIQVDGAAGIGKMGRDQRRFDQLCHAETLHARLIAEEYHLRFAIASHFDTVAQLHDELADRIRVLHERQVTLVEIDAGGNSPVLGFLFLICSRNFFCVYHLYNSLLKNSGKAKAAL